MSVARWIEKTLLLKVVRIRISLLFTHLQEAHDFESVEKTLRSEHVQHHAQNLLASMHGWLSKYDPRILSGKTKIRAPGTGDDRILLMMFMIDRCPDDVLHSRDGEQNTKMRSYARRFIRDLGAADRTCGASTFVGCQSVRKAWLAWRIASTYFQGFKREHGALIVHQLSQQYYELDAMGALPDVGEELRGEIEKKQLEYATRIREFAGPQGLVYLTQFPEHAGNMQHDMQRQTRSAAEQAFLDVHRAYLDREVPDFCGVLSLLEELREMIVACRPRDRALVEDGIDVAHIRQRIDGGVFVPDDLYALVRFIFERIKNLQPASDDEALDREWEQFKKQSEDGFVYADVLPPLLLSLLKRTDNLSRYIASLRSEIGRQQHE